MAAPRRRTWIAWLVAALIAAGGGYLLIGGGKMPTPITTASPTTGTPSSSSPTPAGPATSASGAVVSIGLPDPALTPGATNPNVTQATISSTICVVGWTATIRPPTSFTDPLKVQQINQYHYADTNPADYELDHLIALEVGGAPSDPRNLWPQPHTIALADGTKVGSGVKDGFEAYLHNRVCSGALPLAAAQQEIATNWVAAWEAAGKP